MQKIILLLAMTTLSKVMVAEKGDTPAIPQNVVSAFSAKYPAVKAEHWKAGKEAYTVKFTLDGKKSQAYYSADGAWIKTEKKIKWTWNLPAVVKAGWEKTEYVGWYVENMKEIDSQGETVYVMQVNNWPVVSGEHYYNFQETDRLYFSGTGKLIKTEECDD
jgi:hypothetical protein